MTDSSTRRELQEILQLNRFVETMRWQESRDEEHDSTEVVAALRHLRDQLLHQGPHAALSEPAEQVVGRVRRLLDDLRASSLGTEDVRWAQRSTSPQLISEVLERAAKASSNTASPMAPERPVPVDAASRPADDPDTPGPPHSPGLPDAPGPGAADQQGDAPAAHDEGSPRSQITPADTVETADVVETAETSHSREPSEPPSLAAAPVPAPARPTTADRVQGAGRTRAHGTRRAGGGSSYGALALVPPRPAAEPPRGSPAAGTGNPTVLRIMVGAALRRLRECAGVSREEAGYTIRGSQAKVSRLELGRTGFKERDITDLLTLYGVTDPGERERLLDLARRANEPGWWRDYHDLVPSWFEQYLDLEHAATQIRAYQSHFVPGLLQTDEMVRHVTELRLRTEYTDSPEAHESDEVERRVQLRRDRKRVLTRKEDPPRLWAVLDEAVLHRPIGGPECMARQIDHLLESAKLPNVSLQIIPFERGAHLGLVGPFNIVRSTTAYGAADIVCLEQLNSALYLDGRADVDEYLATMDQFCLDALQPGETIQRLTELRRKHRSAPAASTSRRDGARA